MRASIEVTFAVLLDQLGPYNGAGNQEAGAAGNLRTTVYVQSGDNESSMSAEGIRRRDDHYISAPVVGLVLEEYRNANNGWAHLHERIRQRAEAPLPH